MITPANSQDTAYPQVFDGLRPSACPVTEQYLRPPNPTIPRWTWRER